MSNTTEVPNTPTELLLQNHQFTEDELYEKFCNLSYSEMDNFLFRGLKGMLSYHKFLIKKSLQGDKNLPNTHQLYLDVTKLEVIVSLYEEVE